ncbi:hypothetical protein HDU76_001234 [Blyttiomyces sp. JEL0837]|nr:hypothetical protein HDU76_001234 [Blyttiomyces sp. JEL0837]
MASTKFLLVTILAVFCILLQLISTTEARPVPVVSSVEPVETTTPSSTHHSVHHGQTFSPNPNQSGSWTRHSGTWTRHHVPTTTSALGRRQQR